jgi:hypothetical protein
MTDSSHLQGLDTALTSIAAYGYQQTLLRCTVRINHLPRGLNHSGARVVR